MTSAKTAPQPAQPNMTNVRNLPFRVLLLFIVLSFVDLYLTWFLLETSGGKIYESNPIAAAWLASYGYRGLVTYKIMGLLLVGIVSVYISFRKPVTGKRLLMFATAALALVTLYSYYLMV